VKEAEKLEIPASPDAITPEWLTDALRSSGAVENASVTSFDAEIVGAGSGPAVEQLAGVGPAVKQLAGVEQAPVWPLPELPAKAGAPEGERLLAPAAAEVPGLAAVSAGTALAPGADCRALPGIFEFARVRTTVQYPRFACITN